MRKRQLELTWISEEKRPKLEPHIMLGSRSTPETVLRAMQKLAARLSELGYTLLSGAATGRIPLAFGGIVGQGQAPIFEKAGKRLPLVQVVVTGLGQCHEGATQPRRERGLWAASRNVYRLVRHRRSRPQDGGAVGRTRLPEEKRESSTG